MMHTRLAFVVVLLGAAMLLTIWVGCDDDQVIGIEFSTPDCPYAVAIDSNTGGLLGVEIYGGECLFQIDQSAAIRPTSFYTFQKKWPNENVKLLIRIDEHGRPKVEKYSVVSYISAYAWWRDEIQKNWQYMNLCYRGTIRMDISAAKATVRIDVSKLTRVDEGYKGCTTRMGIVHNIKRSSSGTWPRINQHASLAPL